jgi:hypothetical protein
MGEMNLENKTALLNSVISGELGQMKSKFEFWQMPTVEAGTLWESEKPLKLEDALSMFDPETDELEGTELGTMVGIGWEFVWGAAPPDYVKENREVVRIKARTGMEMTELERLWYRLICADTDMF